jgi:hypothetical protein
VWLLKVAVESGWTLESDPQRIAMRYRADYDLAETVPRALMYYDIGVLVGTVDRLTARVHELEQRQAEPAAAAIVFTRESDEMICRCGSVMVCPDIGCDLHKAGGA